MLNSLDAPMRPTTINRDVATAAAALDEMRPGWARRVNTDTLDLMSGRTCVLGQVFGDETVRLATDDTDFYCSSPYQYGRYVLRHALPPTNVDVFGDNALYRADWIAAIEARRATVAA